MPAFLHCIDGPAGAGKTTYATALATSLPDSQIIHLDDLYAGWEETLDSAFAERLRQQIVEPWVNGSTIRYQRFDWNVYQFADWVEVPLCENLIIEGVGAGQRLLRTLAATAIFLEINPELGKQRVLARDGEVVGPYLARWQEVEQAHFEREGTREAISRQQQPE